MQTFPVINAFFPFIKTNPFLLPKILVKPSACPIGIVAIYNRDLAENDAEKLLVSMGIGFVLLMGVIAGGYYRGFVDRLVIPPLVIFTVLSGICFYFGLM